MKILLAPMEGVIDHHMRAILTGVGGYDGCVTEFLRITDQQLPARVFKRTAPELLGDAHTPTGQPVIFQLLGGDPEMMAFNARKAVELAPAQVRYRLTLATTYARAGMAQSALKELERAAEMDPKNSEITELRRRVERGET